MTTEFIDEWISDVKEILKEWDTGGLILHCTGKPPFGPCSSWSLQDLTPGEGGWLDVTEDAAKGLIEARGLIRKAKVEGWGEGVETGEARWVGGSQ